MNTTSKLCLQCSRKLVGRSDKKFCNDHCRNEFNNNLNSDENNLMRRVNHALRKNRRILIEFQSLNKTRVPQQELLAAGFDFNYCTSSRAASSGKTIFLNYEMGYLFTDARHVEIFADRARTPQDEYFDNRLFPFSPAFA
jgi:hypothetical protein